MCVSRLLLAMLVLLQTAAALAETVTGRAVVAAPKLTDPNFTRTIIYIIDHDRDGAVGIVLNRTLRPDVVETVLRRHLGMEMPMGAIPRSLYGGPVQPTHLLVLHTPDWSNGDTHPVGQDWAVTPGIGALRDIAAGRGPRRSLLAFGYAGWGPGQLDAEVRHGDWLPIVATEGLLFDSGDPKAWDRALAAAGPTL